VQSSAKGTVLPSIAIFPNPLRMQMTSSHSWKCGGVAAPARKCLFPRFHRMGSIGFAGDSLMLKAGQRVNRDSGV
jgi:hypothetical protein